MIYLLAVTFIVSGLNYWYLGRFSGSRERNSHVIDIPLTVFVGIVAFFVILEKLHL